MNQTTNTTSAARDAGQITHPEAFGLLSLKGRLKLESKGMRVSRGPSALSIVRNQYGIKARTAAEALPLFLEYLARVGVVTAEAGRIIEFRHERDGSLFLPLELANAVLVKVGGHPVLPGQTIVSVTASTMIEAREQFQAAALKGAQQ